MHQRIAILIDLSQELTRTGNRSQKTIKTRTYPTRKRSTTRIPYQAPHLLLSDHAHLHQHHSIFSPHKILYAPMQTGRWQTLSTMAQAPTMKATTETIASGLCVPTLLNQAAEKLLWLSETHLLGREQQQSYQLLLQRWLPSGCTEEELARPPTMVSLQT